MPRRQKNGIPNPFNPQDPDWQRPKAPASSSSGRKAGMSPAAKVRARSVGVSSSSRQRTHKRGPQNRKKGY